MTEEVLYTTLAKYYDRIYHWKHFERDVVKLRKVIASKESSGGRQLLDVGCGTGAHLKYLVKDFECTGMDIREEMLAVARESVPDATFVQADMMDFDLGRTFDVVICMFSTIGYARTHEDLERTIGNMARHLERGGVLVIEPWLASKDLKPSYVSMHTYDGQEVKICRMGRLWLDGDATVLEMHYLIGDVEGGFQHFTEKHELRLFDEGEVIAIMEQSGLDTTFEEKGSAEGRGLLVGVRSS